MSDLDQLTATDIGERLRRARTDSGTSQSDAAEHLGVSRPTLVSIEKGQRKARFDELMQLCQLYGASVNRLLATDAVHLDLQAKFRRQGDDESASEEAISKLNSLATACVELEHLLNFRFDPVYPPEMPIRRGPIEPQAEEAAMTIRHRLGLGVSPIHDIVSLLENELGMRVFITDLPSRVSGLFAYDSTVGACIALNSKHAWARRTLTAAHELGHFVSDRKHVDLVELDEHKTTIEERFANAFSFAFLMPAQAVRRRFEEAAEMDGKFTPRRLLLIALEFNVSPEAMCRRLEKLSLLPRGTFDSLKERGFDGEFIRGIVGDPAPERPMHPVSPRLAQLAAAAFHKGLLSEGQLSRMLGIGRDRLRKLIDDFGGEDVEDLAIPIP